MQEIEMLWEMGFEMNYQPNNTSILYHMIENNLVEGVRKCLERQASVDDTDDKNRTAMEVAADKPEILHLLEETVAGKIFFQISVQNIAQRMFDITLT